MADRYDVVELWKFPDRKAALAEHGKGITAIVTSANFGANAELINALPDLKAICSWGVGYETIDVAAAQARGVQVSNTPDVLTDCVADLAWGLLIAAARRMGQGERFVRSGQWGQIHGSIPLGMRVSGKKLGIVGLGRIGDAIAKRSAGFDMQVRYHNRRQRDDVAYGYEASLVELARWADFLIVATVGGAGTRHLVNQEVLEALGPGHRREHRARPGHRRNRAGRRAGSGQARLGRAGRVRARAQVPQALLGSDQAVLLPHIGSATLETRQDMENLMLENLRAFSRRAAW